MLFAPGRSDDHGLADASASRGATALRSRHGAPGGRHDPAHRLGGIGLPEGVRSRGVRINSSSYSFKKSMDAIKLRVLDIGDVRGGGNDTLPRPSLSARPRMSGGGRPDGRRRAHIDVRALMRASALRAQARMRRRNRDSLARWCAGSSRERSMTFGSTPEPLREPAARVASTIASCPALDVRERLPKAGSRDIGAAAAGTSGDAAHGDRPLSHRASVQPHEVLARRRACPTRRRGLHQRRDRHWPAAGALPPAGQVVAQDAEGAGSGNWRSTWNNRWRFL